MKKLVVNHRTTMLAIFSWKRQKADILGVVDHVVKCSAGVSIWKYFKKFVSMELETKSILV